MRRPRCAAVMAATAALLFSGATGTGTPAVAKPCSASYTHAVIDGAHKCLRRGQYCSRPADRQYYRYGFHCHGERLR